MEKYRRGRFRIINKLPDYIPLENAKNIILTALDRLDPELAGRAAGILYDDKRLNLVEVTEAKTNMMMCRPATMTADDVKAAGMYIPGFPEKFGPHFTRQDNPSEHSIIDFEYDGSPRSVVWLAHELGHAVADDIQRENGRSFKDFSGGEMEEQAYFVQHIVSRHLKNNFSHSQIQKEDLEEDVLKMSFDRASQFTNAGRTFEKARVTAPDERKATIIKALDQRSL